MGSSLTSFQYSMNWCGGLSWQAGGEGERV